MPGDWTQGFSCLGRGIDRRRASDVRYGGRRNDDGEGNDIENAMPTSLSISVGVGSNATRIVIGRAGGEARSQDLPKPRPDGPDNGDWEFRDRHR
jgi:hypothetical protein